MVSAAVKALSLMCDDGDVEKALLFGSSYSLDELESGEGNGGKPSSSRNFHASTQLCTAHPWHESSEVTATDPGDLPPRRRHWRAAYKVNFFTWILLSSNMPRPSDPAISICSIWQFRNWLALSGFDNAIDAMPTSARLASITFQPVLSRATGSAAKYIVLCRSGSSGIGWHCRASIMQSTPCLPRRVWRRSPSSPSYPAQPGPSRSTSSCAPRRTASALQDRRGTTPSARRKCAARPSRESPAGSPQRG